jgi:hypothetical protein
MRLLWQFIGTLLLMGLMLKYWWLIALVIGAVVAWRVAPGVWHRHRVAVAAEQQRLAELSARADEQHRWVMQGDLERGVYGMPTEEGRRDEV